MLLKNDLPATWFGNTQMQGTPNIDVEEAPSGANYSRPRAFTHSGVNSQGHAGFAGDLWVFGVKLPTMPNGSEMNLCVCCSIETELQVRVKHTVLSDPVAQGRFFTTSRAAIQAAAPQGSTPSVLWNQGSVSNFLANP